MLIILEILGFLICLNSGIRLLFAVSVYAGLKGANKWTAQGEQVEINNVNLKKAVNTLRTNAILLVVGGILIFIGENYSH
ncbi:hypothetical protein HYN59_11095 [Flavobacterium album]|uniref:Uncharacterized protein n=1 Tax=Flavobacterium album TaxID=2175091 RepID=A0A2S1QYZ3_9FLAO|nr:hypothetical protein [Flavobacterium album]AWH85620.1 hypothetical protein HYN59_11095 [Flavobacterium album]